MNNGLSLRKISYYLPKNIENNDQLKSLHPDWDIEQVQKKTGIYQRYYVNEDETSLDLGIFACKSLFKEYDVNPNEIEALLFVSQTPDYALPPSSCILQEKLCMRNDILALDINLLVFSSSIRIFFCLAGFLINGSVCSLTFLLKNHVWSHDPHFNNLPLSGIKFSSTLKFFPHDGHTIIIRFI